MSHVDEGRIAAYLDGALATGGAEAGELERHVAGCTECRALLERSRHERERAREILRGVAPDSRPVPAFEAVVTRRRRTSEDGRRLGRLNRLAWAASVVLAVAVGWYARQVSFRSPLATSPAGRTAEVATMSSEAPTQSRGVTGRREATAQKAVADAPRGESVPVIPATPEPAHLVQQAPRETRPAAGQGVPPTPSGEKRAPEGAPVAALAAPAAGRLEPSTPAPQVRMRRERAVGWTEVTASVAARALGGPVVAVPGLPITGYAVRDPGEPAVRVTQILGDGRLLELIERRTSPPAGAQGRAMAALDVVVAERDSGNAVTAEVGNYVVTARAAVSRDSLRALVAILTPVPSP